MPADPAALSTDSDRFNVSFAERLRVKSPFRRAVLFYGFTALLCLACLAVVLHLRDFNPLYPYNYSGDSLLHVTVIKAITEHGWYQFIDRLVLCP